MASWQGRVLNAVLRIAVKSHLARIPFDRQHVEDSRQRLDRLGAGQPMPGSVELSPWRSGDLNGDWFRPESPLQDHLLLYFHGGAFITGSPQSHRGLISRLAQATWMETLAPQYPLIPENPHPAALDYCVRCYRQLITDGYDPANLILAGDSAGASLALALLSRLRREQIALPAGVICYSPWTDLGPHEGSRKHNAEADAMLPASRLPEVAAMYSSSGSVTDPEVSPVHADKRDWPSLMVHVGSHEILLDDATRLSESARNHGVDVQLKVWDRMPHAFPAFVPWLPEALEAVRETGQFVRRILMQRADTQGTQPSEQHG